MEIEVDRISAWLTIDRSSMIWIDSIDPAVLRFELYVVRAEVRTYRLTYSRTNIGVSSVGRYHWRNLDVLF